MAGKKKKGNICMESTPPTQDIRVGLEKGLYEYPWHVENCAALRQMPQIETIYMLYMCWPRIEARMGLKLGWTGSWGGFFGHQRVKLACNPVHSELRSGCPCLLIPGVASFNSNHEF